MIHRCAIALRVHCRRWARDKYKRFCSVVVLSRGADMTILVNGDVKIVEAWQVKFIGGPFTSAFREIPLNKVTRIDGGSVADEVQPYRQRR
jgi:hypothetical protein